MRAWSERRRACGLSTSWDRVESRSTIFLVVSVISLRATNSRLVGIRSGSHTEPCLDKLPTNGRYTPARTPEINRAGETELEWPSGPRPGSKCATVCGRIAGFETGRISVSHAKSARLRARSPGVAGRVAPVLVDDRTGRINAGAPGESIWADATADVDQFQQAMAMMVQMFGTMHRDQMEVIREELERLNELSDEVHALRDRVGRPDAGRACARILRACHRHTGPFRAVPVEPTIAVRPAATETAQPEGRGGDATGGPEQPATARSMPQQPSTPISGLSESAALARSLKTPANNDQGPTENSRPFGPEPSLKNNETKAASTSERIPWSGFISGSCFSNKNARPAGKRYSSSCPGGLLTVPVRCG